MERAAIDNATTNVAEDLLAFVGDIYQASYQPEHWNVVISELCRRLGAKSGGIHVEDYHQNTRYMMACYGLPKVTELSYRLGVAKYDPVYQIQSQRPIGKASMVSRHDEARLTHPLYYRLIVKPNDLGYVAAISFFNDEHWHVGIGVHRSFNAQPFGEAELQLLDQLAPHFQRALLIQRQLHLQESRAQTLEYALSKVMLGTVIVDQDNTIRYRNDLADRLLDCHPALVQTQQGFKAYYPDDDERLREMLQRLRKAPDGEGWPRDQAVGLRHPDRSHPLTVIGVPCHETPHSRFGPAEPGLVALYLSDPGASFNASAEQLIQTFGLTRKEAGIAIALTNGLDLKEISAQKGVSLATVRTQLKSIFHKLGVNKQQDVIRILLASGIGNAPH
ncbi:helix-turn-helix transcriptional regulator [Alcanivorax jadensis]|uniref:helix-turn-helix transcriptional regulator n=1 Tax=Alcanivorax jadensis TaxID=64988 RepID=UPI00356388EB